MLLSEHLGRVACWETGVECQACPMLGNTERAVQVRVLTAHLEEGMCLHRGRPDGGAREMQKKDFNVILYLHKR